MPPWSKIGVTKRSALVLGYHVSECRQAQSPQSLLEGLSDLLLLSGADEVCHRYTGPERAAAIPVDSLRDEEDNDRGGTGAAQRVPALGGDETLRRARCLPVDLAVER